MTQDFDNFIGTRAVSQQHRVDVDALAAWLEKNLDGFKGPLTVEMFKGGQSNPTYKLITPSQSYVMRAKPGPVAKLLPSAHAVEREFKVMSGLGRHRRAGAAHVLPVRGRVHHRPRLLRHGVHGAAACCGTSRCPAWTTPSAPPSTTR